MKKCSTCKIEKPLDAFWRNKHSGDGHQFVCIECGTARNRSPEQKDSRLRNRYGITLTEFDEMAANGCHVCGTHDLLGVDHDHATGQVRGVLCRQCNAAEGHLRSQPNLALALAAYMIQYEQVPSWA